MAIAPFFIHLRVASRGVNLYSNQSVTREPVIVGPYTGKRTLDLVCSDPAVQIYLTKRMEKYRRIPYDVNTRIRTGAYKFLRFCRIEPTNHAFSDIIAQRLAASPEDKSLEKRLKAFREATKRSCYSSFVRSIFKANGIPIP